MSTDITIGKEVIRIVSRNGNTITNSYRAASGTMGGAQAYNAGALVSNAGSQLEVSGNNTTYRDFEVMNSRPGRDQDQGQPELGRGNGVHVTGDGNRFINLVIHDNLNGLFTSSQTSNTEIYGVISYNNGVHGTHTGELRGFGHGYYLENNAGYSKVYENISLNNFNQGMQGYGVTAPYVGGEVIGAIFFNNGSLLGKFDTNIRTRNMIIGPDSQLSPTALVKESHFYHPSTTNGYLADIGYGAGITNATVVDNYFVGGGTLLQISAVSSGTITGNKIYSPRNGAQYTLTSSGRPFTWNNNTYYGAGTRNVFGVNGMGLYSFNNWKSATGWDSSSTMTSGAMPDTVIVRPNVYQAGRANVAIYSFSGAGTAAINLSNAGLTNGQSFTIRSAQNYYGTPVYSGTYNAASPTVTVSLSGPAAAVATPVGYDYTPATTCPQFCPMVVVPN